MTKNELMKILSVFKEDDEITIGIKWRKDYSCYADACIKKVVYNMENGCMKASISFMETDK